MAISGSIAYEATSKSKKFQWNRKNWNWLNSFKLWYKYNKQPLGLARILTGNQNHQRGVLAAGMSENKSWHPLKLESLSWNIEIIITRNCEPTPTYKLLLNNLLQVSFVTMWYISQSIFTYL